MKGLKYIRCWAWEAWDTSKWDDEARWKVFAGISVIGLFLGNVIIGLVTSDDMGNSHTPWWGYALTSAVVMLVAIGPFTWWKTVAMLGIYYKVPSKAHWEVKQWYLAPKAERDEYHGNVLGILRNPNITTDQAGEIAASMKKTRLAIASRKAARARILHEGIDIQSILDYQEHSVRMLESDTKTYREAIDPPS